MKIFKSLAVLTILFFSSLKIVSAGWPSAEGLILKEPAFCSSGTVLTYDLNTNRIDNLSVQLNWSTAAIPSTIYFSSRSIGLAPFSITITTPVAGHGSSNGYQYYWQTISGTIPTNLKEGGTYYLIKTGNPSLIGLATSLADAQIGFSTSTSDIGTGLYALNPLAMSSVGTSTFTWQASNDGVNWFNLSTSTVYYPQGGFPWQYKNVTNPIYLKTTDSFASYLWDFGQVDFKYLGLYTNPVAAGGIKLEVWISGKSYSH